MSKYSDTYIQQLDTLDKLIDETNNRILAEVSDAFFDENINFLTKSFMIMMSAYLESYIKDISMYMIEEFNIRLKTIVIPRNIIKWDLERKGDELPTFKKNELKFENLNLSIKKKELDPFISGNPHRINTLMQNFGIELDKDKNFEYFKEIIQNIITKRNSIIHHNDEASDLSAKDLKENTKKIKEFIFFIDSIITLKMNQK